MAIYLHIGMQKTGTTSLQRLLASKRDELLSHGLSYPFGTAGLGVDEGDAHHFLAHAVKGRKTSYTPDIDFSRLDEHCAAISDMSREGDVVLSSEDFSLLSPPQVATLAGLLPSGVKVVVYFRRQDYWADSLYGQMVKIGAAKSFKDFISKQNNRLNYLSFIHRWCAAFGEENIIIRTYEGDTQKNTWPDFCTAIKRPDLTALIDEVRKDNPSLTKTQSAMLDIAPTKNIRRRLRMHFERQNSATETVPGLKHATTHQANEIMSLYEESNSQLALKFLGSERLFADTLPANEADSEAVNFTTLADVVRIISDDLSDQIDSLSRAIKDLRS